MNLTKAYEGQSPIGWSWAAIGPVLPAVIVAYACLLPRELTITLGDVDFRPYRISLLLVLPFVWRLLSKRPIKTSIIDLLAAFVAIWHFISFLVVNDLAIAIAEGFSQGADFGLAYLTGRASIRSAADLKQFFLVLLPGLIFIALLLAVESIFHQQFLRPFLAELLNQPSPGTRNEVRMGLMRATGPFPHPILGGVFLASILSIAWYASSSSRSRVLGVCVALSCIFSVSSAAVLGLLVSAGLIVGGLIQRLTRWPIFMVGTLYLLLVGTTISLVSKGGLISFLINRFTFDAQTGAYRKAIWEFGGAEVGRHPIFGIGTADWIRPAWMGGDSVDAHWLLLSMRHGLPLGITFFLVVAGSIYVLLHGTRNKDLPEKLVAAGLAISLVSLVFSGFTVFFWEGVAMWMVLLAGIAVSIGTQARHGVEEAFKQKSPLTWQERIIGRRPS